MARWEHTTATVALTIDERNHFPPHITACDVSALMVKKPDNLANDSPAKYIGLDRFEFDVEEYIRTFVGVVGDLFFAQFIIDDDHCTWLVFVKADSTAEHIQYLLQEAS